MVTLQVAPIQQPKVRQRDSFLAPNGTFYTIVFPTAATAADLVDLGVVRIVSGASWRDDLWEAMQILVSAGIDVVFRDAA